MKQFAIVFAVVLSVPCFGQEFLSSEGDCYIDQVTGRQVCPLKKTAAAVGKTVVAVGNAITPNSVPAPMQASQVYAVPSYSYSAPVQSYGWSKSWHKVNGQPLRNLGRRLLGR